MAQTETFDPKRYTPFAPGVRTERVLSTFPAIDTAVDNIKFSQGLERIAQVMDRGALIRTFQAADLGFILHSRHQYHWHTGYVPPQPVADAASGRGDREDAGPAQSDGAARLSRSGRIWRSAAESRGAEVVPHGGISGHRVWAVPDYRSAGCGLGGAAARPNWADARFTSRRQLYRAAACRASRSISTRGDFQRESLIRSLDAADRLLTSPSAKAFDLSLEPKKSFDVYNNGRFGQGCLLARRLVEAGARYVEVTTEYIPFRYWDSHENGHERAAMMKQQIDAPVAQLILDLEERGLLNRTLVVLASEFGRDAITEGKVGKEVKDQANTPDVMSEPKHYGMHRHFTGGGFGGAVRRRHRSAACFTARPRTSGPARRSRIRCRWKICTRRSIARWAFRRPIVCGGEAAGVCDQRRQGQGDRGTIFIMLVCTTGKRYHLNNPGGAWSQAASRPWAGLQGAVRRSELIHGSGSPAPGLT